MKNKYVHVALLAGLIASVSLPLYFTTWPRELHDFYRELYFFPVFYGALRFGLRGSLIVCGIITIVYFPFILKNWGGAFLNELRMIAEILFLFIFAVFSGYIIDKEKKMREELERNKFIISLGRITSGIVHDLKNPLNSTIGLLEKLAQGKGKSEIYIPVMLKDAYKMERIVYDVLDFARQARPRKRLVNLSEVMCQAIISCRQKAKEASVKVVADINDVYKEVDSFLLERAIVNIVSNAIDASKPNQDIEVSLHKDEGKALIRVKDNGPGMDQETYEHCFDPYFSSKQGGTGLGLPIVKKIIDAHNGSISVECMAERGTEVLITLP